MINMAGTECGALSKLLRRGLGALALAALAVAGMPAGAQNPPAPPAPAPAAEAQQTPVISPTNAQEVPMESADVAKSGGAPLPEGAAALPTTAPSPNIKLLMVADMDIAQVLDRIRQDTGVVVRANGKAAGTKLSLRLQDVSVEDALDAIAKPNNWRWVKRADGSYDLYDQETYVKDVLSQRVQRKVFSLKYIDAVELNKVIEPVLTPDVGASSPDERTNSLIVTDLPDKLAMIESIIREYDVQLYTHVFDIQNADTEDIADRLDEMKSKYATIEVDAKNHTIIVKDETLEKIKTMEQIVELLDRDQEIRVYNMVNIGEDGKDAEDLIKAFIEPLVTKDAVLEFNESTSQLYVKDVRAVQKKILEVLKQVDIPRRQVLIEGELLSTAVTNSLSYGVDWQFGSSLLDAINTNKIDPTKFPTPQNGVTPGQSKDIQLSGFPYGSVGGGGLSLIHMNESVRAALSAAITDSRTRLLLKPRIILGNHKEGSLEDTQQQPILSTFYGDNNNSNNYRTSSQSFVDSGLQLSITPAISNRGLIELDLQFEQSKPIIVADIGNGTRGVGKTAQTAKTTLIVPSGETRVIGGLISRDESNGSAGVPYLSQIPVIGALFGNKTNEDNLRNLIFFITPTIIETQPTNDYIVEPVNTEAKISMAEEDTAGTPPAEVNPIPEDLRPYLDQIRPQARPYSEEDGATTATETTTGTLTPAEQRAQGAALLSGARTAVPAATAGAPTAPDDIVKTGGSEDAKVGRQGPSGTFGGPARPAPRPRNPQPTPPPATPIAGAPVPAPAPAPAGGGATPNPAPTPTPAPTPPAVEPAANPTPAPTPPPDETRF